MDATLISDAVIIQNLLVKRGAFALRDIDVRVPTGFVTGVVGPNGAGKTSLIKALLGLIAPDEGTITLFGAEHPGNRAAQQRIGVVLDRVTAMPEWHVGSIGRRIGPLYAEWDEELFRGLLERFEIPAGNRVDALSRGQSVKLSLAMALAHRPQLLLLDEPSSGLDPVARRDLADIIREFMVDPSHTVLFSTHITSELDELADHIIVLNDGLVAFAGMLDELHERFAIVRGRPPFPDEARPATIGLRFESSGVYEALIRTEDTARFGPDTVIDAASTDDVVVHFAEHARSARHSARDGGPAAPGKESNR